MNQLATKAKVRERCINLKMWCKDRSLSYVSAYALINRGTKKLETRNQVKIIDALIADGLFVAADSDSEGQTA